MADMEFALAFTGDTSDLKAASAEAKEAVSSVSDEASRSATDINAHAAALEKEASAARKAADANAANANATRKAREEAARAAGATASSVPVPVTPAPVNPRPAIPRPQRPPQPLPPQPPQPGNDNQNAERARRQVLGYQLFDIGQSSASGMPLGMIAAQQGPQIAQLYAGQGGTKAALNDLKVIGGGVMRMFTPITVGLGTVAAAAAVGISAYASYLSSIKQVQTAAAGFGRAVAGTASEMEASAKAGAAAAGVSVSAARSMQAQFLQSGKIGAEHYEGLIAISKDFAATVGMDADAAGAALTEMFSDPAKAAQTLNRQYGLLDAATTRRITDLSAQNRVSEAQGVLLDALPGQLANAERATTALGRAWQGVSTWASNALDAVGEAADRVIAGPSLQEQLANIDAQLNAGPRADGRYARVDRNKLRNDRAKIQAEIDAEAERTRQAAGNQREATALGIAESSGANASAIRRKALENNIAAMRSGLNPQSEDVTGQQMITAAIEAQERVLDALIHAKERNAELDRLDIQIANEKNPVQRAELEARRTRLQMAGQEASADKIAEDAQRARNRVIAETVASAGSQLSDMRDELEVRQRLAAQVAAGSITQADANRMLSEELTLRPLVAAAASAEAGDKEKLQMAISGLRDAYASLAAVQREEAAQAIVQGQSEKLEQLRVELSLIGQSDEVRRRSLALLEAEQRIRSEGISADSKRAEQIRSGALAIADQTAKVERLRDAWGEVQSAIEGVVNNGVDKLIEGDWSGALDAVKEQIVGSLTQIGIKNPLANALDGGNRGTITDLGGVSGIVGRLFGGDSDPSKIVAGAMQSVGSMNVNAATVIINGGIGGDVSRIFGAANNNSAAGLLGGSTGIGSALSFTGNYKGAGVDSRLTDILSIAAQQTPGFKVDAISGFRAGDPRYHGKGMATDIQLTDLVSGKLLGNYQDASSFSAYERFAQTARQVQMAKYPELADQFRWGGYFGGSKGKYGALDTMHFDLAGKGMAGGSWESGLTSAQRSLWPGIESQGTAATKALQNLAGQGDIAAQGLGSLGTGLDKFGSTLSSASAGSTSSGGGVFGWLKGLFGGSTQFAAAAAGTLKPGLFSNGGWTGPGGVYQPAGIVHAGEVVFSQADVARHGGVGNVEAIRLGRRLGSYASGGAVAVNPLPAAAFSPSHGTSVGSNVSIAVNNYSGQPVQTEEKRDQHGNRQMTMTIGRQVAAAMQQRGNDARRTMQSEYGIKPAGRRR